jgi:5'-3' exonuclease
MGVPSLFINLFLKYKGKGFVKPFPVEDLEVDELYLDANCLIHPVCMRVFQENKELLAKDLYRLEQKMIHAVLQYTEELIALAKPKRMVYIAIDGVAPLAKIKHQRIRRFKSVKEGEVKEAIAAKHGREYVRAWNNSAITPGTVFMRKLTLAIVKHLQNKVPSAGKDKLHYIFSSCNTPAEGEHKILQHIRNTASYHDHRVRMIYGLDADLLYLALACGIPNVYLLREKQHMEREAANNAGGFNAVCIDTMKRCIHEELGALMPMDAMVRDYIFLGFLLGNDFLPALPSVNLKVMEDAFNGLQVLMKYYRIVYPEFEAPLVGIDTRNNRVEIHRGFFVRLLEMLAGEEEAYFYNTFKKQHRVRPCASDDPYEVELYRLENLMFKYDDPIQLGKENTSFADAKVRYYKHYEITDVSTAVEEYLKGLHWVAQYYFYRCPDWLWQYPYEGAPFVGDIHKHLVDGGTLRNPYPTKDDGFKSIRPVQQLLMVLPPQSRFLLPPSYARLMDGELKDLYPRRFELDFVLKKKYWQAHPVVPLVDHVRVLEATKEVALDEQEQARNRFKATFEVRV